VRTLRALREGDDRHRPSGFPGGHSGTPGILRKLILRVLLRQWLRYNIVNP
jgi:hypothetical protein